MRKRRLAAKWRRAITIAVTFASVTLMISTVNKVTSPIIQNKLTLSQTQSQNVKPAVAFTSKALPSSDRCELMGEWTIHEKTAEYYRVIKNGKCCGYVIESFGDGFSSLIQIIIALDDTFTICGIEVLSQEETPGLGDQVITDQFTKQFIGKNCSDLSVTTEAGKDSIQAITGATISSKAVSEDAIHNAIMFLKEKIKE